MRKVSAGSIRYLFTTAIVLALLTGGSAFAQRPFNKAEFVARREKLFEKILDGIAVLFRRQRPSTIPLSFARRRISIT